MLKFLKAFVLFCSVTVVLGEVLEMKFPEYSTYAILRHGDEPYQFIISDGHFGFKGYTHFFACFHTDETYSVKKGAKAFFVKFTQYGYKGYWYGTPYNATVDTSSEDPNTLFIKKDTSFLDDRFAKRPSLGKSTPLPSNFVLTQSNSLIG